MVSSVKALAWAPPRSSPPSARRACSHKKPQAATRAQSGATCDAAVLAHWTVDAASANPGATIGLRDCEGGGWKVEDVGVEGREPGALLPQYARPQYAVMTLSA